ncbi:DsbA family oxidoreductase [Motilibacter aurantiacus]|uniref:DsbA family oxidoreductase n=1 Tax=Motilibacter aurantiacus TaxID=2714955 RepID=UPI001409AB50|nr:DsbA family oxidoreductase [Motilibacter aurantiacus]NHC46627.1 DsbA family oxidoreductase [Motilibacter aurantiacus]
MKIDVWSDVACPWCYIGKRRLEKALEAFDGDVEVEYHAFVLDPSAPDSARPLDEHLRAKFGDRVEEMQAHVTELAAAEGLDFRMADALAVNTLDAHRLIAYARRQGVQPDLKERLLRAYFTEGRDVGDHETLANVAAEAGLDRSAVEAYLASDEGAAEVQEELAAARDIGITAVPTYVVDRKYAVQGAQDPATFLRVLEQVARETAQ